MLARYTGYNVTWVTDQGYTVVPLSCEWCIDGVGMDLRGQKKKKKIKIIHICYTIPQIVYHSSSVKCDPGQIL
jgi:hypothetical protein